MYGFVRTLRSVWSRLLLNTSFRRNPPPALDNDSPLALGFRGRLLGFKVLDRCFIIDLFVWVKQTSVPRPLTTAPSTLFLPPVSSPDFDVRVRILRDVESVADLFFLCFFCRGVETGCSISCTSSLCRRPRRHFFSECVKQTRGPSLLSSVRSVETFPFLRNLVLPEE